MTTVLIHLTVLDLLYGCGFRIASFQCCASRTEKEEQPMSRKISPIFCVGFLLFWGACMLLSAKAQETQGEATVPLIYTAYTTGQGALHGGTPLWHHANTYGRVQNDSQTNWLSGFTIEMPHQQLRFVDVTSGLELTSRVSDAGNSTHFSQIYGSLQYQGVRFRIGRFKHTLGGHGGAISMGSMMTSGNATPVPKIELSTPLFFNIPLSNGRLQAKIYWSEGKLESNRHIPSARLHQKALHLRALIGNVKLVGGLIQSLQWGGDGRPNGFSQYQDILFNPKGGGGENTVAIYEVGAEVDSDVWEFRVHRQFFLEDWIGLLLRSPWDGIWSFEARRESDSQMWMEGVLYEFMNTIQQDALPGLPEGRVGYYTHHTYRSGWTYHGNTIGNPLIRNPGFRSLSQTNFQTREGVADIQPSPNTMVIAHHLGLRGQPTARTEYEARFTYSRNYGVCQDQIVSGQGACFIGSGNEIPPDLETIPRSQLRQDQYATMLNVRYLLSEAYGMRLRSSVAVDWGEFDGTQIGVMLGLQWDGTVNL